LFRVPVLCSIFCALNMLGVVMGTPLTIHFRLKLVWQDPTLVLHLLNNLIKVHRA